MAQQLLLDGAPLLSCSQYLTIHLPIAIGKLLIAHCSLLTPHSSILIPHSSLLTPHCSLLIAHCSLLNAHSSLLTPHCSFLIAHSSLLTPHCSLLTPHSSILIPPYFNGRFLIMPPFVSLILFIITNASGSIFSISVFKRFSSSLVKTVKMIFISLSRWPLFPKPRSPL